jgi:FkbM family methyltransferase
VFLHGEFDFAKLQTALAILAREGQPVPTHLIDVGANIDTITIPALKRGLLQTATAIEPHPHNLRLLRANIALNGLEDRVTVLAQAVGDRSGVTLHLHESATNSGNHSIGAEGIPVASSRLDDLDFPSAPSLLWMDIEGYEGHALIGAERLLAAGTSVVCEFNPSYLRASGGMSMMKAALDGHKIFNIDHEAHPSTTTLEALETLHGSTFTDILAIPKK